MMSASLMITSHPTKQCQLPMYEMKGQSGTIKQLVCTLMYYTLDFVFECYILCYLLDKYCSINDIKYVHLKGTWDNDILR